jgi:curved DNA-binding protein CbpA
MNPFDILELQPGASADEVKAAYHRLAKMWHPDRFDAAQKAEAEERFRQISEAFEALRDPVKRQQVEKQIGVPQPPKPEPPKSPVLDRTPADWFEDAKRELENGDPERALGLAQYAIRLDGQQAAFHVFLAQLLERQGRDKRTIVRAYETAFQLNPKDVDVALHLGGLFQALGMEARAQRMFQVAKELAPNHKYFKQAASAAEASRKKDAEAPQGMMDQVKSLWNRLARKE